MRREYTTEINTSSVAAIIASWQFLYEDTSTTGRLRRLRRAMNCAIGRRTTAASTIPIHAGECFVSDNVSQMEEIGEESFEVMVLDWCDGFRVLRLQLRRAI